MRRSRTLTKVFLHHRHDHIEWVSCEPVGRLDAKKLFRVATVPLRYGKPTYGDIIAADRDEEFDGHWAWECPLEAGAGPEHLHEDGGRYTMVIDYSPPAAEATRLPNLPAALNVVWVPARDPSEGKPGRLHLAIPAFLTEDMVLKAFAETHPGWKIARVG